MCQCGSPKYRRTKTPPVDTVQKKVSGAITPDTLINPAEPKPIKGYRVGSRIKK